MPQIYIAGIHTDVGKTHFSVAFCKAFGYGYFKLVQAGEPSDSSRIRAFMPDCEVFSEGIYLATPASPHIAKVLEGCEYHALDLAIPCATNLIIELAGGLYTPIDDTLCMIDYMLAYPRPCILVGRYYLGCINHILLSMQALHTANIEVLCIAMLDESTQQNQSVSTKAQEYTASIPETMVLIDAFLMQHNLCKSTPLIHVPLFDTNNFVAKTQELYEKLSPLLQIQ